ncbi:DUF2007 domain-containing protein [Sphingobacteriales bacterium UPWRP_1]|nr:hypothetical protein B6N25_02360 [Sphingobacteriales bacterium TSM_CSS]PSJ75587.1 DUF2007 domain-containing protein [Sphingobacteriales bacterium UPWRP_1]
MEKNWVKIYSTTNSYLAEILKNVLLTHGIECVLINKQDSSYLVFGEAELYTHINKAEKALQIIEEENV